MPNKEVYIHHSEWPATPFGDEVYGFRHTFSDSDWPANSIAGDLIPIFDSEETNRRTTEARRIPDAFKDFVQTSMGGIDRDRSF